jgi:hypothetical protein
MEFNDEFTKEPYERMVGLEEKPNEFVDLGRFHILQYGRNRMRAIKICSITYKPYFVDLTYREFKKYYKPEGKSTRSLKKFSREQREFLRTTLTPDEIKSIHWKIKKMIHPKLWRKHLNTKNINEIVSKMVNNDEG